MTISKKILGYVMLNTCSVLTLFVVLPFWEFTKDYAQAREPVVITVTTTIQAAIDISGEGDTINVPADYASTTEAYPIDFYGHQNVTLDCQFSGALITPSSTEVGQIIMTTGTVITGCSFSNIEVISYPHPAADLTFTRNNFTYFENGSVALFGSGFVNISENSGLNSIFANNFSSSSIIGNVLRVTNPGNGYGIFFDAYDIEGTGTALISNNYIYNYKDDTASISINGFSEDIAIIVSSNTAKYINSSSVSDFFGAIVVNGFANVNYHHNYIDVSKLKIDKGAIFRNQYDPSFDGAGTSSLTFNHNTFVFSNNDNDSGPNGLLVEALDEKGKNAFITSTYNLWVNVGATSSGTNAYVLGANTSSYSSQIYSDYDGFWNFENIFVDEDAIGNNTSTITNSFTNYPFFKTGDTDSSNDLDLTPFSNYLDAGGPEGADADIGAYNGVRRNSVRVASYANLEDIDYDDIDVTSTAHIGDALRTGGTIYLLGNGSYGEDLYGPIIISSSSLCTSSISIRGGFSGSSINATGSTFGINLVGINSTTIEDINIYDSSGPAIKLVNSSDNYVYNVYGIRSDYGIWFSDNSQNNSIVSSGFYDNILYDIYSNSDYDNTLTFTRFNSASSSIVNAGNVDVYNNFYLVSKNSSGELLGNVGINILDNKGGQSFTTTTNDGGYIWPIYEPFSFLAWTMSSSSPTSTTAGGYNPFTITASKAGYITTSSIISLINPDTEAYLKLWKTIPTSSSNIAVSSVNTSSVTIFWTDNSDNEDGFIIEKSTASTSGFIFVATTSIDTTSTIINALLPNTQYWFRVAAFNLDNTSTYITTTEGTYTLATDPSSVSAVANSATQITVSWTDDDSSAYYVSRTGNNSGWITSTSHIFSGLTCGTSYTFNVKAKNYNDLETDSVAVTASTGNCSSGGGGGGGSSVPAAVNAIDVPLIINGTQQGTLSYNAGGGDSVQVVVPANSFTGSATFRVVGSSVNTTLPAGNSAISGGVYVITATDSSNNPVSSFSNNLNITFTGLELPADVSSIGVYYLNETTNEWILIPGAVINPTAGTVTFSVNHFTKFAVLNVPGTPSTVKNSVTKITAIDGTVIEGKLKIKVSGKPAIYWLDQNNNYYYYPDGDVFKSWNVDESYNYYKAVSQVSFDSLSQPSVAPYHVFYRNGSEVVKYLSSDKLYVVGLNNVLYPITNEAVVSLYGSKYKPKIIGLSEWPYYVKDTTTTVGINSVYPGMFVKIAGKNYFIDSERKIREITNDAMRPNHLKPAYFRNLANSAVSSLETGSVITNKVSELTSFMGY